MKDETGNNKLAGCVLFAVHFIRDRELCLCGAECIGLAYQTWAS